MTLTSVAVGFGSGPIAPLITELGLDYAATPWQRRSTEDGAAWHHETPRDTRWWGTYAVRAGSLAEARSLLPLLRSEGKAHRFILLIEGHAPHEEADAWTPRHLVSKAAVAGKTVSGFGFATVIDGGTWVTVHAAATAALREALESGPTEGLGGLRVGITDPGYRSWLAGDPVGSLMTPELLNPEDDDIYAVDVIVGQPSSSLPRVEGRITPTVWTPGPADLPPVDTAVISPRGFLPDADGGIAELVPAAVVGGGGLTERELASLRNAPYLVVDGARFQSLRYELGARLSQLAVAGVPMLARDLPADVGEMIGRDIVDLIGRFDPAEAPVQRESKSIDLRRAALERFAPRQRWSLILGELDQCVPPEPTVSVLLATRRPERVGAALAQVAQQSWEPLQVVLVLHGFTPADHPSVRRAVETYRGHLTVVTVPAGTVFGEALNAGTRAAEGVYLAKMDDDDWYGAHHIRDLVRAAQHSGAQLVGSQVEFVYLESLDITTRRPSAGERYTDHVAGGTMVLRLDDLRQLGGWRPVHRAVDRCLLQAVQAAAGRVYRSHGQNYLMHRHAATDSHGGHTWNPEDSIFLQSVAEQWDGFAPPPQITARPPAFTGRSDDLSSYFTIGRQQ
ncbi:glycosyltransferase family 2 protein [Arthrobacter echini]|uniref:Glycosyltransferase family 2 protein n=1 Tax=Arthrobacter echini TaxID=1529066 RepID=A0A4S5E0V9_9MICC|nr:glycosyltransferase [Arthrobacter echini]THJ64965.1 glycosyltransferase family 2 protein [Arthrobacter echini]